MPSGIKCMLMSSRKLARQASNFSGEWCRVGESYASVRIGMFLLWVRLFTI